jgi:hypothetical protein
VTAARASRVEAGIGCVLAVEVGVVLLLTDDGVVRASYGAGLLGDVARDQASAPAPGDWVRLRRWHDGPVTVEATLGPRAPQRWAAVVPLHAARRRRERGSLR